MSTTWARPIGPDLLEEMPLPEYSPEAGKHVRGKLLIIAGSRQVPGAALLAARAALRAGCGTVRVAAPASVATAIGVAVPELMVLPLIENDAGDVDAAAAAQLVEDQYPACRAAVIGPGLAASAGVDELVRRVVAEAPLPLVVDARALLAWRAARPAKGNGYAEGAGARVFTPHLGELSELLETDPGEIEADRDQVARSFARAWGGTLVLKGPETLITSADHGSYLNTRGTRGLGTAGSGDTLAGIIGSLLAQGLDPVGAAVWGVHLHALAGEAVAAELGHDGLMARDFVERLPLVLRALREIAPSRTTR